MGSDPSNFVLHDLFLFQFSLSVWGATFIPFAVIVTYGFSILAPCVGSDYMATTYLSIFFNSRSPHGERQSKHEILIIRIYFQFTLPAWRATGEPIIDVSAFIFSIHAPRMGSDGGRIFLWFYPASSVHFREPRKSLFSALLFWLFFFVLLMVRAGAAYTFLSMVTPFGRFSVSIVTS